MKEADKIGAELKQVQIVSKDNVEFLEQTRTEKGFEQDESDHVFELKCWKKSMLFQSAFVAIQDDGRLQGKVPQGV